MTDMQPTETVVDENANSFSPTFYSLNQLQSTSTSSNINNMDVSEVNASLQHFDLIDYAIFILMLVLCVGIGVYFSITEKNKIRKQNAEMRTDMEVMDYFVGGRKMNVIPVSLSLVASSISAISLLGFSTEVYVYGTKMAFLLISLFLSAIIAWVIFLPVLCNLQLISIYEYFEMRFGRSARYFCSILFVIGVVLYLPVAVYVPALTFNQVSGINVHIITPVACIICTFYTCVGGLKAVVWTDAIQSFMMYGSVLTICVKGTLDLGGINMVINRNWFGERLRIPDLTIDPTVRLSMLSVLVGGTLHFSQVVHVNQMSIQRFLALPNMKSIKQSVILFTTLLMCLNFCCIYMGLLTYATYYNCDPLSTKLARADDQLPTLLVMRTLGAIPGLPGLFVAGVFSAALSSLSTGLNSLACVMCQDLIKPFVNNPIGERESTMMARLIVVVCGVCCIGLVFLVEKMGTVLQLAISLGSVSMGPLLGFYIAGVCLPWVNEKSILLGGITSFLSLAWICLRAQWKRIAGTLREHKLPVSIDNCTYSYDNVTAWSSVHNYTTSEKDIYHLSFLWYTSFGAFTCCLVALMSTFCLGGMDMDDLNPNLVTPMIRRYIKKKGQSSKRLKQIEICEKLPLNTIKSKTFNQKTLLDNVE